MHKIDDIQYAIENSQILREPDRRIDTFGATRFRYTVITEDMDQIGHVRVRTGELEAQKPAIIKPASYSEIELEGFDEKAREYFDWLKSKGKEPVIFQYGFQFKRKHVSEELVHDAYENVKDRVLETARKEDDPMLAVIEGVEDAWEIGLLKFAVDMIEKSKGINQFDFKRRGLL